MEEGTEESEGGGKGMKDQLVGDKKKKVRDMEVMKRMEKKRELGKMERCLDYQDLMWVWRVFANQIVFLVDFGFGDWDLQGKPWKKQRERERGGKRRELAFFKACDEADDETYTDIRI